MKNEMPAIRSAVERIYDQLLAAGQQTRQVVAQEHRQQKQSATNLMHYMALRRVDLRALQDKLHDAGLSSLASAEGHILQQVQEVLCRTGGHIPPKEMSKIDAATGAQLLLQRSESLFGEKVYPGIPFLMVTLDTVMAEDYEAVKALIKGG